MIFKILIMKLRSFFVSKPTKKLMCSNSDYKKGKKWAMSQPHPFKKGKTLWDLCYDKQESTYTIDNLNKFLFNEI
jgi:hypothetical protein